MELLGDPTFKNKYQKSKLRVKLWESDFMEKYGRRPNKNDIKEADTTIREAYKMYWKLKTKALEESLMDITFSDEMQSNISTNSVNSSTVEDSSEKGKDPEDDSNNRENRKPNNLTPEKKTDFEADPSATGVNAEGVWGNHLNNAKKVTPKKKQSLLVGRSSSFQLSQKIFKSSSFTKRNPRKSLSFVKSKSKSELEDNSSSQKGGNEDGFDPTEIMKPMYGEQLKVVQGENKLNPHSISAVRQLIDGKNINICRNVDAGWLDRCSGRNKLESLAPNSNTLFRANDSGVESAESSTYSPNTANSSANLQNAIPYSEDEDFICNSDSEGERKNKRVRNAKRCYNNENQTAKRQRVDDSQISNSYPDSVTNECAVSNNLASQNIENNLKNEEITQKTQDNYNVEMRKTNNIEIPSIAKPIRDENTIKITDNLTEDTTAKVSITENMENSVSDAAPARSNSRKVYNRIKGDTSDESDSGIADNKSYQNKPKAAPNSKNTRASAGSKKPPAVKSRRKIVESESVVENYQNDSDGASIHGSTYDDADSEIMQTKKAGKETGAVPKARVTRASTRTKKLSTVRSRKKIEESQPVDEDEQIELTKAPVSGSVSGESDSEIMKTKRVQKKTKAVSKPRTTKAATGTKKPSAVKSKKKIKGSEPVDENEEIESRQAPIYAVETLNAVPRFLLPKTGSGDLVADFSQVISRTDSNELGEGSTDSKTKKVLTAREKLEKKVASGNINENFVRINLKKKVFVRGKKTMTFSKYKKNQWKQKKKELASGEGGLDLADLVEKKGTLTCFKCGGVGHFSRECRALKSDEMLPLMADEEPSEYPSLDEAAKMADEAVRAAHKNRLHLIPQAASRSVHTPVLKHDSSDNHSDELPNTSATCPKTAASDDENLTDMLDDVDFTEDLEYEDRVNEAPAGHKIPENLLARLLPPETGVVEPLYQRGPGNEISEAPTEVLEALNKFGHEHFRPGQEKAVMRILSGQSTLVTLSTGSGKSLCYQLPAYVYAKHFRCITLVISPLVSLMDDQVVGVPKFLSAACLHTAQGSKQKNKVMEMVRQGTLDILLVSPEAVVAGEKSTGFGALLRQLPPIAFACIDEAHCISQWSHNFRPSYLMVCKVLREKLGVKTVLGLTATATKCTAQSIVDHLSIPDGMAGVISDTPLPRNLNLSVSKDEHRDRALIDLLGTERFKGLDSIIIYCTRRDECVRIAGLLRTSLPNPGKSEKNGTSSVAEAYHAGLSAHQRKIVQKAFMSGQTKIVVATVAFGMGINKADIRSVIHYNMPASFEGYVQEVGRAGRDGLPAHCHLFLSSKEDSDKRELRRHVNANGVDRHMVRRLLQKVFVPCSCREHGDRKINSRCPGHEVAIAVDEIVSLLDISQEIITTLLCYLELHPKRYVKNLPSVYINAKITSYGGPNALKAAAQKCPPLAMAIALDLQRGISHDDSSIIEFPVVEVASAIGWDSGVVKGQLKDLEWATTATGHAKRTPISVTFDTLGLRVRAPGDLSDAELDEALDALTERTTSQQHMNHCQLEAIYSALSQVAVNSVRQCRELTEDISNRSLTLKTTIREYFLTDDPMSKIDLKFETKLSNESQIINDIRSLVANYCDNNFTGRAVARIFHGIQSPNYSALVWSRCRFWRAHLSSNFDLICQVATREILAMK